MITETVTDLVLAPSPSSVQAVLKTTNIHDLQVYSVILTVVLCLIVFGGVKIINKVGPAFLIPVLLSVFLIFIGILAAPRRNDPSEFSPTFTNTLGVFTNLNIYDTELSNCSFWALYMKLQ
jgi:potassium/chloride transporter 4/5/6